MRVDIHQPDLAAEERRRLAAAEDRLRAAAIGERLVHQVGAVGKQEMFGDEIGAAARLRRRQQPAEDRLGQGNQREGDAGGPVAGMEKQFGRPAARD